MDEVGCDSVDEEASGDGTQFVIKSSTGHKPYWLTKYSVWLKARPLMIGGGGENREKKIRRPFSRKKQIQEAFLEKKIQKALPTEKKFLKRPRRGKFFLKKASAGGKKFASDIFSGPTSDH